MTTESSLSIIVLEIEPPAFNAHPSPTQPDSSFKRIPPVWYPRLTGMLRREPVC